MALSILPKEGDYATLKILNNLKMSLSFTEQEVKDWGIVSDLEKQTTTWKENGEAEIALGEKATDIIVKAFRDANVNKKLNANMISAYEKFIPTNE